MMLTWRNFEAHLTGVKLVQRYLTKQKAAYETKSYNSHRQGIVCHHLPLAGLQVGGLVEVVQGGCQP